jgi:hypothetical protein
MKKNNKKQKNNKKFDFIIVYKLIGILLLLTGFILFLLTDIISIDVSVMELSNYNGIKIIFGYEQYEVTHITFNIGLLIINLFILLVIVYYILSFFIKDKILEKINKFISLFLILLSISLLFTPLLIKNHLGDYFVGSSIINQFENLTIKETPIFTISILFMIISSLFFIFYEIIKNSNEVKKDKSH